MAKPQQSQPAHAVQKPSLRAAPEAAEGPAPRRSGQSVGKALRDVVIFGVLLVAGLGLYYRHVQTSKQVNHVAKLAKDLAEKDTPQDFLAAEKDLERVLTLDSTNGYALATHAELDALLWGEYGYADRRQSAEDYAKRADAVDAPYQERFTADALVQLYAGDAAGAKATVAAVIKRGAHGAQLLDALGRAQRKLGELTTARENFKEAAKDWRTPRFNADYAQLYFDMSDTLNALSYFEKALSSNPDHPGALIGRARAAVARGEKIKLATDDLASLLGPRKSELSPTLLAQALTARAELKMFNRQWADAVKDAREATSADRAYAPGYEALGLALAHDKAGAAKSLSAFDQAIHLDPYVAGFTYGAAKALVAVGLADKGVAMMQRLDKSLPRDENYFLIYGDLLDKKGDPAGALAQYDEAIKINGFSAPAWFAKGKLLQSQKKYPDAEKAYEAALGAQENFPEVHQQRGWMLLDAKKPVDAAGEFEQALELFKMDGAPREKLTALRDGFEKGLKKAPKGLQKKFEADVKVILH
ncbi:MAG: tetratricopeptide repeat protein [Myxococcales bacterium]